MTGAARTAREEVAAWDFAVRVVGPWASSAREIGSEELAGVMSGALTAAEAGFNRALDRLEREAGGAANAIRGAG